MHNITCMKCTSVLERTKIEDVEIDHCPACGGLWLDRGEIDVLSKMKTAAIDELRARLRPRGGPPPVPSELRTACPACTEPMREVKVGTLPVDYCSACRGIFLDRGELDAALALVANADTTMISLIAAVIVEVPA